MLEALSPKTRDEFASSLICSHKSFPFIFRTSPSLQERVGELNGGIRHHRGEMMIHQPPGNVRHPDWRPLRVSSAPNFPLHLPGGQPLGSAPAPNMGEGAFTSPSADPVLTTPFQYRLSGQPVHTRARVTTTGWVGHREGRGEDGEGRGEADPGSHHARSQVGPSSSRHSLVTAFVSKCTWHDSNGITARCPGRNQGGHGREAFTQTLYSRHVAQRGNVSNVCVENKYVSWT